MKGYNLALKIYVNESLKEGNIQEPLNPLGGGMPMLYMHPNDLKKLLEYVGKEISKNERQGEVKLPEINKM